MAEFDADKPTPQPAAEQSLSPLDRLRMRPVGFVLLALTAIFVLYQVVGGGLTILIFGQSVTEGNVEWMRFATIAAQLLFLLVPTLLLMRMQHGTIADVTPRRFPKLSEILLAVIAVVSLEQVMEGYLYFQDMIPLPDAIRPFIEQIRKMIEETYRLLVEAHNVPELIFVIVVVALTPAVCEELLFRGLIQKNISLATSRKRGYILTGIIFGLYHMNPFLAVPLIALGILFGFLMYKSETILLPMIAHFTNNLFSIIGSYADGNVKDTSALSMFNSLSDMSVTLVVSMTFGFGILFIIAMYFYLHVTSTLQPAPGAGAQI